MKQPKLQWFLVLIKILTGGPVIPGIPCVPCGPMDPSVGSPGSPYRMRIECQLVVRYSLQTFKETYACNLLLGVHNGT